MTERNYLGWAAFEDMAAGDVKGRIVFFSSPYKTKRAVEGNVSRCISEAFTGEHVADVVRIYGPDDGERCVEEAQAYQGECDFELVSGIYEVKPAERSASGSASTDGACDDEDCIVALARDYGADPCVVRELFDCWMVAVDGRSYEEELTGFREAFDALRGCKAVE